KRFLKKTGMNLNFNGKETVSVDKTKGNRNGDAPRRIVSVETPANAMIVQDEIGGYDWSFQAKEGLKNFALMTYTSQGSSSSSSSDSEVHTCSKDCLKSYETLQKQYDQQCVALNISNLEIIGYQMGLESLESRIVVHEKNEAVYEEDIAFLNAKDKAGLGCDSQINKNEVVHSVFNSKESDVDDSLVNDRFKTDYQEIDGGFVAFVGSPKGGKITGKGKNIVHFHWTKCLVLSPDFKLLDESQVLLKVPRQNNMYSFDLKNVVPSGELKMDEYVMMLRKILMKNQQIRMKEMQKEGYANSTNRDSTVISVSTAGQNFTNANDLPTDPLIPLILEDYGFFSGDMMMKMLSYIKKQRRTNHKDYQNCLFICFLSQNEPKKVWTLVDLPKGKRAIGTKWVYRNKKDERGIVVRNKERLVAQGYTQEKGIYYGEMDVKSAFLYGTIEEESLYETLSTYLLENGYRRGTIDKTLFIKKDRDYAQEIPDEFYRGAHFLFRVASHIASTLIETNKALLKDEEAEDVDVHLYRLMIGSLMYLTASRPDIMFVVCACARFQVTPKVSHLHAVKRIFRYLKGQPKLGLWYPMDSPFDLEAFSDSDYTEVSLDTKSITRGCQFLSKRLISWQCKKQTIFANSITEAEYVVAANCCGQTQKPRKAKRTTEISQSSGPIHLVADETVYKEWEDRMERAATTASSLEAEQDSGNINRTQSMATLNESFPQGTDSGSGPRCQDTILGVQKLKLGLRLHLNSPMIHLSQELTHLEVGRTT
ncbi:uncharacterized mitochondrial protein-like protein, partial [Tanacetum coccineum]